MAEQKVDFAELQKFTKDWREMDNRFHFSQLLGAFPKMMQMITQEVDLLQNLKREQENLQGEIVGLRNNVGEVKRQADQEKEGINQSLLAAKDEHKRKIGEIDALTNAKLEEFKKTEEALKKELRELQFQAQQATSLREKEEAKLAEAKRLRTQLTDLRG